MSVATRRSCWVHVAFLGALACGTAENPGEAPGGPEAVVREVPRVERIDFSPSRPRPGDRVIAEVTLGELTVDEGNVALDFTWRLDGVRQPQRGRSFDIPEDARGNTVEVMVIARDGLWESAPVRKGIVPANREPRVHAVVLDGSGQFDTPRSIEAIVRAEDPDGDPLAYEYRWTVDGQRSDEVGSRFPLTGMRRGDEIQVEVVASDGVARSRPKVSRRWSLENSPPRISSSPSPIGKDGVFRYRVIVEDPDRDRFFRYRLVEAPAGMKIDPGDGSIAWRPLPKQVGTHRVILEVDDRHGGFSRQEFELGVGLEEVPIAGR